MAESVKKRSEIEEAYTWKLEDMIESPEKFEELMDGVEERIPEYEAYRGKLGNSAEYLKNYLTYDESVDETLSLLSAYAMQKRSGYLGQREPGDSVESPIPGREGNGGIFLRGSGDLKHSG